MRHEILASIGFILNIIPLLLLAFFSPGVQHEGPIGIGIFIFGLVILFYSLFISIKISKLFWVIFLIQLIAISLVSIAAIADNSIFYIGT